MAINLILALVFRQAQKYAKAMLSYEKALMWQELFDVALQAEISTDDLSDLAYRVSGVFPYDFFVQHSEISMCNRGSQLEETVFRRCACFAGLR